MFAIFKYGKRITKGHSVRWTAVVQAMELGFVYSTGVPDSIGDQGGYEMAFFDGYEIKEYEEGTEDAST